LQLHRLAAFACAVFVALIVLVAAAPQGKAEPGSGAQASIIGGHSASIAEFPSLAYLIGEDATGAFSCTGTVIAPRVILTAGHCVENLEAGAMYPDGSFAVATGVANLKRIERSQISEVEQAVVFPGFTPKKLHGDAGLLILAEPVAAPPLPLATAADAALYAGGSPIDIAGWGQTNPRVPGGPAQLQAGSSVVLPPGECKDKTKRYEPDYVTAQQVCAVDIPSKKSGACHGDSGGPAIAHRADGTPVEIGIVSTGGPNCNLALPNIFTRVDYISTWVAGWVAAAETGTPPPALAKLHPRLPVLSFSHARELSAAAFEEEFKRRFLRSSDREIRCSRLTKAKVKCNVAWYQGGDDYFGSITTKYVLFDGSVAWDYTYRMKWVNDRCYFHSGNRKSCVIHTQNG
jgi:secreted trypsin-like serine protease